MNRVIYPTEALFVGPTPATGKHFSSGNSGTNLVEQIHRVQTINFNKSVTRTNINQMGQLASIDRVISDTAVGLDFSYYFTNVLNEHNLGFVVDGSCAFLSGILNKTSDDKNYFVEIVPEGNDAIGYSGDPDTIGVIAFGQGFINSYSVEAAVGGHPTANVSVQALNVQYDVSSSGEYTPAVSPENGMPLDTWVYALPIAVEGVAGQSSALKHGDISVDITGTGDFRGFGSQISDLKIQNFNLSVDLNREPLQRLGSRFPFSREIRFPVTAKATINANVGNMGSGGLPDTLCDDQEYGVKITLRKPSCSGNGEVAAYFDLRAVKMDSERYTASIGPSKTVAMEFSTEVGGPQDENHGLFISGIQD